MRLDLRKPGTLWPVALVAVLAITVVANVALLVAARDPHAAAVEPNYYARAVAWDSTAAEAARSTALGWSVDAEILSPGPQGARVRVVGRDRDGRPLDGARVGVVAVHNLEADVPVTAGLAAVGGGTYEANMPLHHPGLWELRLDVRRGGEHFMASLRREAVWARSTR